MKEHEEKVIEQYEDEIKDGMMIKVTLGEALDKYGADLVIAATGAIAKKARGPTARSASFTTARTGCS